MSKFKLSQRFKDNAHSSTREYRQLASDFNSVDLAQSTPDYLPPRFLRNALLNLTVDNELCTNQHSHYTAYGNEKLRRSLSKLYSSILHRTLNPDRNFLVTSGVKEALYVTISAHTSPGDEWIVIEPFCELYPKIIESIGGVPVYVELRPMKNGENVTSKDWSFDIREVARSFGTRTKGVIVNNPHRTLGKVFSREELQFLADLAIKWNTLVVVDEVYEFLVYEPSKHLRMASFPRMLERTITISSVSKTFAASGWKIGWAYGPSRLINDLKKVQSYVHSGCSTPIQLAIARVLDSYNILDAKNSSSYISRYAKELSNKREKMTRMFSRLGMKPVLPQAGHCFVADWTQLVNKFEFKDYYNEDELEDRSFVKWLIINVGVALMPITIFYNDDYDRSIGAEDFVRCCFVKKDNTLNNASNLMFQWVRHRNSIV